MAKMTSTGNPIPVLPLSKQDLLDMADAMNQRLDALSEYIDDGDGYSPLNQKVSLITATSAIDSFFAEVIGRLD